MQARNTGMRRELAAAGTRGATSRSRVRSTTGLDSTLVFLMGFGALIALLMLALLSPLSAEAAALEPTTVAGIDVMPAMVAEFALRACGVLVFAGAAASLLSISARDTRRIRDLEGRPAHRAPARA